MTQLVRHSVAQDLGMIGDSFLRNLFYTLVEYARVNASLIERDTQPCVLKARRHIGNNPQNELARRGGLGAHWRLVDFRRRPGTVQPSDSDPRSPENSGRLFFGRR